MLKHGRALGFTDISALNYAYISVKSIATVLKYINVITWTGKRLMLLMITFVIDNILISYSKSISYFYSHSMNLFLQLSSYFKKWYLPEAKTSHQNHQG